MCDISCFIAQSTEDHNHDSAYLICAEDSAIYFNYMIYLPVYLSSFNNSSFIIAEEIVYFTRYNILIKEKKENTTSTKNNISNQ